MLAYGERATAIDAIAELAWNAIDAEATRVDVTVELGELGGPTAVIVADDGHGMSYEQATEVFTVHGESWKKNERFSPALHRPLHGRLGRGRFLVYALGDRATWTSVAELDGRRQLTTIEGMDHNAKEFRFDGPTPVEEQTGTTVQIRTAQSEKAAQLTAEHFPDRLTARLAPSLHALDGVSVYCNGRPLDPNDLIVARHDVEIDADPDVLFGHDAPELVVIEWHRDPKSPLVMLCDEHGLVVTDYELAGRPGAPFHWTAYVLWSGFADPELMGHADLHLPQVRHRQLLDAAESALRSFLHNQGDARRAALIQDWKEEGSYPYAGEPTSPSERIERQLFEVAAVVASPRLGRSAKDHKLSLGLLREAMRSDAAGTRRLLNAVLELTDDERDTLEQLLDRTELSKIVRAANTVAERLDFLQALRQLLYADETRQDFREVDQLHPMLVREPWVFGDEWTQSLNEAGLTRVVRSAVGTATGDRVFAPKPVKTPSGKSGRVDMVFYRHLPESEGRRHLVVELKRASRTLNMADYSQVMEYATAITGHAEVTDSQHRWDFWLVGSAIDGTLRNQIRGAGAPDLAHVSPEYRVYVMSWGRLLEAAARRHEALRRELDLVSTEATATEYLTRVHQEFIPPLPPVDGATG